jgi:hypothetical protein
MPIQPTPRDVAQLGRVPALGAGGRRFESCHPDHLAKSTLSKNDTKDTNVTPKWCFAGVRVRIEAFKAAVKAGSTVTMLS